MCKCSGHPYSSRWRWWRLFIRITKSAIIENNNQGRPFGRPGLCCFVVYANLMKLQVQPSEWSPFFDSSLKIICKMDDEKSLYLGKERWREREREICIRQVCLCLKLVISHLNPKYCGLLIFHLLERRILFPNFLPLVQVCTYYKSGLLLFIRAVSVRARTEQPKIMWPSEMRILKRVKKNSLRSRTELELLTTRAFKDGKFKRELVKSYSTCGKLIWIDSNSYYWLGAINARSLIIAWRSSSAARLQLVTTIQVRHCSPPFVSSLRLFNNLR